MADYLYDDGNIDSILDYSHRLEFSTVDATNERYNSFAGQSAKEIGYLQAILKSKEFKGKGGFGQFLEEIYFGKKNDNLSQPDFPKVGVELKVSPLKVLKSNNQIRVKERLVLNHFTFTDIDKEVFDNSHFKEKNQKILIAFYMHDSSKPFGSLIVNLCDLWECLKEDEAQLRKDWQTIVNKVKAGKAHEISEGDTLYLGACTKGSTAENSMQIQPHSDIMARGRALCFKTNYINQIYQILLQRKQHGRILEQRLLSKEEVFEEKILSLYKPFLGKYAPEICNINGYPYNVSNKSRYANIARKIVGLNAKEENLYEFNASGIQLKTIRVEPNGRSKESMSFKNVDYCEIVDEEWEDSDFYNAIISKFIIVLFKRNEGEEEYYLDNVIFWQIPVSDYEVFQKVWEATREKVISGDYENFIKMTENRISHIRPKGKNSSDLMITPQGKMEKKKCFWINQEYIQTHILDKLYK